MCRTAAVAGFKAGATALDAGALVTGLGLLGLEATTEEAKEMIREFDQDRDGYLNRTELLSLLTA